MKNVQKIIGVFLVLSLFLIGCSNDKAKEDPNATTTEEQPGSSSLESDEDVAAEIEEDKDVEKVMVQLEKIDDKNYVNADITVSSDKDAEKAAEKFAKQLKEKYPDHIIDLILIYEGDVVFQDIFE